MERNHTKKRVRGKKSPKKAEHALQNSIKVIRQFVLGKSFSPMSEKELVTRLKIVPSQFDNFRKAVAVLEKEGVLKKKGTLLTVEKTSSEVLTGVLRLHRLGYGFLQPDKKTDAIPDVFIPKHLTMSAVDGDRVEVLIHPETFSEKGPEGRVLSILSRARKHLAGTIIKMDEFDVPYAYVPLLGKSTPCRVKLPEGEQVVLGDRVVLEVKEWGDKEKETVCEFKHCIGHISDPSCDVVAAIEEFGLKSRFPVPVIEEAKQFSKEVTEGEEEGRVDLQEDGSFTIDPDTAKDFDDAVSVKKNKAEGYSLHVHIADVTHYVRLGSAIENEAKERANSVYFPGKVIPMLPEELSNELCSLKPKVKRLAISVLMQLDQEGALVSYEIVRSVIKSRARLTYREAKEILDEKKKSVLLKPLRLMVELCLKLKKIRYERGSIEFSLPDFVVLVDDKGVPVGTDLVQYDITHQMIEEFMLKANEVVALHLSKLGKPFTYRIHDEPAEENIKEFSLLARAFGFTLSDLPTVDELQKLFEEAATSPFSTYLASNFIRRMKMAYYSPNNIGHYGLALTHYCHFTSPIRRYADVIVHRVLFDEPVEKVEEVSLHCSDQERIAAKAESSVVYLKKLRLLQSEAEKSGSKHFNAVVTKIKPFGFYFEVIDLMIEGFIHVSELNSDFYVYNEKAIALEGKRTKNKYFPGKEIGVYLLNVDLMKQEVTWHIVEVGFTTPQEDKKKKTKTFRKRKK